MKVRWFFLNLLWGSAAALALATVPTPVSAMKKNAVKKIGGTGEPRSKTRHLGDVSPARKAKVVELAKQIPHTPTKIRYWAILTTDELNAITRNLGEQAKGILLPQTALAGVQTQASLKNLEGFTADRGKWIETVSNKLEQGKQLVKIIRASKQDVATKPGPAVDPQAAEAEAKRALRKSAVTYWWGEASRIVREKLGAEVPHRVDQERAMAKLKHLATQLEAEYGRLTTTEAELISDLVEAVEGIACHIDNKAAALAGFQIALDKKVRQEGGSEPARTTDLRKCASAAAQAEADLRIFASETGLLAKYLRTLETNGTAIGAGLAYFLSTDMLLLSVGTAVKGIAQGHVALGEQVKTLQEESRTLPEESTDILREAASLAGDIMWADRKNIPTRVGDIRRTAEKLDQIEHDLQTTLDGKSPDHNPADTKKQIAELLTVQKFLSGRQDP